MNPNRVAWVLVLALTACAGKRGSNEAHPPSQHLPTGSSAVDTSRSPANDEAEAAQEHPDELMREKLWQASVLQRLDGFQSHESGDLQRVQAALGRASPDMFVHTSGDIDRDVYRPAPRKIGNTEYAGGGGYWPADESYDPDAKGLRAYGGVPVGELDGDLRGNWIRIHRPKGYPKPLAANTPGIVWEIDGSTIVFVSLDGGRYELAWDDLAMGVPQPASWPAAVQHDLLTDDDVEYLVKGGALDSAVEDQLEELQNAFHECTVAGWKGFDRKLEEALVRGKLTLQAANAKEKLLREQREDEVAKDCQRHIDAFDAALVGLIEARRTERLALLQWAKANALPDKLGQR